MGLVTLRAGKFLVGTFGEIGMRWMKWLVMAAVLFGGAAGAEEASKAGAKTEAVPGKELSVLTVGNSFAENALKFLPQIAKSAGYALTVGRANLGGCPLERHWKLIEASEKDPNDPKGKYTGMGGKEPGETLKQKLTARKWDFITIQQYSMQSSNPATYQPYAGKLVEYIKQNAPAAKILVHHTWAYRVDDPQFKVTDKPEQKPAEGQAGDKIKVAQPKSQKDMYQQVHAAYMGLAKELGLEVIPSGPAFFAVDTSPEWGYKPDAAYDKATAAEGKLPDQKHSLHVGYSIKKDKEGKQSLGMDGHHAGKAGEYLAGLCYFEKMTGVDSNTITFVPEGVDADFAAFLRKTAHEAVLAKE